jgi:hypothetical protein
MCSFVYYKSHEQSLQFNQPVEWLAVRLRVQVTDKIFGPEADSPDRLSRINNSPDNFCNTVAAAPNSL